MSDHTRKLLEKSVEAIEIINENISDERSLGRDKRIGNSFLFNVKDTNGLEMVWKNEILPLLEEYCYSNEEKKKNILFSNETQSINLTNMNEFLDLIINARKQTNRDS